MLNVLCGRQKGFNIVHLIARSLNSVKIHFIRHVFECSSVDVVCVSETWFLNDVSDVCYSLKNYNVARNDRVGKRGGGVAIYCKTSLTPRFYLSQVGMALNTFSLSCLMKLLMFWFPACITHISQLVLHHIFKFCRLFLGIMLILLFVVTSI